MRFKSPKLSWLKSTLPLVVGFAAVPAAFATGDVNPVAPYLKIQNGTESAVFYPSTQTSDANYYPDSGNGFALVDFDALTSSLHFTVSGLDTTNRYLYVFSTDGTTYVHVPISTCAGGTCTQYQVDGAGVGVLDVGIVPKAICDPALGGRVSFKGCSAGGIVDQTTVPIVGITLYFVISSSATEPTDVNTITGAPKLHVYPETGGPRITGCPTLPGFFPGDTTILVDTSGFAYAADSATGSSPNFPYIYVSAQKAGALPVDKRNATIFQRLTLGSGQVEVGPFENSTEASQTFYTVDYAVGDSAGIFAYCSQPPAGTSAITGYPLSNVFSTDIQGFLRESKCFVATASYRDGRAPGVMLLRQFRDKILTETHLGRSFIAWYYSNGPIAAEWLIEHPVFRSAALLALMPLQAAAWVALHPSALALPFLALFFLLGFFARRFGFLGFVVLLGLATATPKALAVDQPYIDSLISQLPKDPYAPAPGTPDPYVQSIKRKLGKSDDSAGYTEEMKKQIPASDGSEGYTDRIRRNLPTTTGSAIEDYRNGKVLHPNKGSLDTRSAFGFNLMASENRTYTSSDQTVSYDEVYGNGWVPDFTIHYEWRPFTWSLLKKFALYSSVGTSFTKAKGVFDYKGGGFGSESHTEFKFITIPVDVGLMYRFSLFGFMWPYFGGGPSAIGFLESRSDKQKGHHGYDLGYWFMGGVAFGLDWISPKSSWDQYESTGVKHSYFTIDYSYLESLPGGLVDFTVDGVNVGFTFEL